MSKRLAAVLLGALPALAMFPGLVRCLTAAPRHAAEDAVTAGHLAHARGDWRGCVDAFGRALHASPEIGGSDLHTRLGQCHVELGQLAPAIAAHRRAVQINPQDHVAWVHLGLAHARAGAWDEAQRAYERALAIEPYDALARAQLALAYERASE